MKAKKAAEIAKRKDAWARAVLGSADLPPSAKALAWAMSLHFSNDQFDRTGELVAFPSWDTLASIMTCWKSDIGTALKRLEKGNFLKIERRGRSKTTGKMRHSIYRAVVPEVAVVEGPVGNLVGKSPTILAETIPVQTPTESAAASQPSLAEDDLTDVECAALHEIRDIVLDYGNGRMKLGGIVRCAEQFDQVIDPQMIGRLIKKGHLKRDADGYVTAFDDELPAAA